VAAASTTVCSTMLVNQDAFSGMRVHALECDCANADVAAPPGTAKVRQCMYTATIAVPPRLMKG
jgi:hypothetical protein